MTLTKQTHVEPPEEAAPRLGIPLTVGVGRETARPTEQEPVNLVGARERGQTSGTAPLVTTSLVWSSPPPETAADASIKADSPGAKGVVLHIAGESVQCEFLHGDSPPRVWLPRSLFPADVTPGYTFELSVDTENGFRAPQVRPRKPIPNHDVDARLAKLLAEFEK